MRWLAILAVGLALSVQPVGAQGGRVLLDLTLWVVPPDGTSQCVQLPPGRLLVTAQAQGDTPTPPLRFSLAGYRGSDEAATMLIGVTRTAVQAQTVVQGGLYCYAVTSDAPVAPDAGLAGRTAQAQPVAVRWEWLP